MTSITFSRTNTRIHKEYAHPCSRVNTNSFIKYNKKQNEDLTILDRTENNR